MKESVGPELSLMDVQDTCPLMETPSNEQMKRIIERSCNGKAAEADGVRMEYIKYADEETIGQMNTIWRRIYVENKLPKCMTESIQVPIPKITRPLEVDHFRRIILCISIRKMDPK